MKTADKKRASPMGQRNTENPRKRARSMSSKSGRAPYSNDTDTDTEVDDIYQMQRKEKKPRRKLNDAITALLSAKSKPSAVARSRSSLSASLISEGDGVILSRTAIERQLDDAKLEEKAKKIISNESKVRKDKDRIKPTVLTLDYEKKLRKVATRGVVKLFNAIQQAQRKTVAEVRKSNSVVMTHGLKEKTASVSKSTFLDLLRRRPTAMQTHLHQTTNTNNSEMSTDLTESKTNLSNSGGTGKFGSWNVLTDNFMMGAKLKDWKENEVEEEVETNFEHEEEEAEFE